MTKRTERMTEDDLRQIVDRHIQDSQDWVDGTIGAERKKAMQYYLAQPVGDLAPPALPERSRFVSTDVADTVEWILPALMEIFTAGDDVVEFVARRADDEPAAQQMTEVANYVFYQQNPGWQVLLTWFKDALLQKSGIVKVWWDDTPEQVREEYRDLTDKQLTMLLSDSTVEPIEHTTYVDPDALQAAQPSMTQDAAMPASEAVPVSPQALPQLHRVVVVRTTQRGQVRIEAVPPEEFLIARDAKQITDGFCAHRVQRTLSELRQQGYAHIEDIASDDTAQLSQDGQPDAVRPDDGANGDEAMRKVWLTECYLRVDYDGDGMAEWRKVVRAGNALLENVECDGPPFVSLCPVPLPHRFFGTCPAEQAMTAQSLKTHIVRGLIDNMRVQLNSRTWVERGKVDLEDLLNCQLNGIVRVDHANAIGKLQEGMTDASSAYQLLHYADEAKQDRTGVTKYTQGSDADTLNKTARGIEHITARSDQRIKLIARIFAETGMKTLFLLIQKLLSQYQDRAMVLRLRGSWVDVDPRAWKNQYDMVVNVGLGTGDKTQVVEKLTQLGLAQQQGLAIGIATPQNLYETGVKLTHALGYKNAESFWTDPSKQPPAPAQPPPDPLLLDVQLKAQTAQQKLAFEREKFYADLAVKREAIYMRAGIDPYQEAANYATTLASGDMINGAHRTDRAGPSGSGNIEPPADTGSVPDAAESIPPAVGTQPGAGA